MRSLDALLLFSAFCPALSIPCYKAHTCEYQAPLYSRRTHALRHQLPALPLRPRDTQPLSSLLIPTCALTCYINTLTTDGCSVETDFKCHCSTGNLPGKAESCLESSCSEEDQRNARKKIITGCRAVGVEIEDRTGSGGQANNPTTGDGTASLVPSETQTITDMATMGTSYPTPTSSSDETKFSTTPAPTSEPTLSTLPSTTSSSQPTDSPLSLDPSSDRSISTGAKAGISVSVSIVAFAIILFVFLYIRRLKRQLRAAKAAADIPESVWQASMQNTPASGGILDIGRRRSSRRRSRRESWNNGQTSPVSPLSPVFMRDSVGSITGMLNKARSNVLSVVVEREDEDASSVEYMVREPVPGQKEGLVDPLELDGEFTGIVELPTSITPRARSSERDRDTEKDFDFGEPSRRIL